VNAKKWKDKYIYLDMNEFFFEDISCLLHEWIKIQAAIDSSVWALKPVVWDQFKLEELKVLDNKGLEILNFCFLSKIRIHFLIHCGIH
jgi:hypothetical protein